VKVKRKKQNILMKNTENNDLNFYDSLSDVFFFSIHTELEELPIGPFVTFQ